MIKPNELRIGNWVKNKHVKEPVKVLEVLTSRILINANKELINSKSYTVPLSVYEGVPLTPEILIKCGFTYEWQFNNGDVECYDNGIIHIQICFTVDPITFEFVFRDNKDEQQQQVVKLLYLHQLQNLYFSLTGKELEINL